MSMIAPDPSTLARPSSNPMTAERIRVVLDPDQVAEDHESRFDVLADLLEAGVAVTRAGEGSVAPLDDREDLIVLRQGSHPGPVESEDLEGDIQAHYRGIAGLENQAVVDLVKTDAQGEPSGDWKPWFPVIDYDRCTNCMQCLSFCLFGVYDVDAEKQIDVKHPERCKTNCPACSRVCPEVAILFPKYKNGPINGDVVQDADLAREKMKTDISSLLGGDIYKMLRERSTHATSRFSKERDESRALKERQRCLAKLKKQFDIPDDVLAQLPTADAIREKAEARMRGETDD